MISQTIVKKMLCDFSLSGFAAFLMLDWTFWTTYLNANIETNGQTVL